MIGQMLGHYEVKKKLGAGGMGEVFQATDTKLGRDVAIKVVGKGLTADPKARDRLLREARTASALNHPHICTIHEIGESDRGAFIVMEHVVGETLSATIPSDGLPQETIVYYASQIANALSHAHERGVVHRDLKTTNVIITPERRVKVLDFGLARVLCATDGDVTATMKTLSEDTSVEGTLPYLAPEVLRGEPAGFSGDIWAVGVMLYEMATGELPFTGKTGFEISAAILHEPASPLPSRFSTGLDRIVQRCLNKEPPRRYQSPGELVAALESVQSDTATIDVQPSDPERESGDIIALAVLPLDNLSGDPDQNFFADGMTEAITASVAKVGAFRVISRTSAMHFKGSQKPLPVIARELNVDAVMEGSVVRSGDKVRITAQLVHAATDQHLWAETYDRDMRDILELQSEVSRAIVKEIQAKLMPPEDSSAVIRKFGDDPRLIARTIDVDTPTPPRRVDPEAYEAYLRGRYFWNKRTTKSLKEGIKYFKQAIDKDPTYALAYSGMAECYNVLGFQGAMPTPDTYGLGTSAAKQALQIDDTLAEAHFSLGYAALHHEWDWVTAGTAFKRGSELDPSYATGHHWNAMYYTSLGEKEKAISQIETACELDPLSLIIRTAYGFILHLFKDYDDAIAQYKKALEISPDFWAARVWLGNGYVMKGLISEGLAELHGVLDPLGTQPMVMEDIGYAQAVSGATDKARKILKEVQALSKTEYVRAYSFAKLHLGLGENDEAMSWLEKAYEEKGNWLNFLKLDPTFDPLRDDSRFQDLLGKIYRGADKPPAII